DAGLSAAAGAADPAGLLGPGHCRAAAAEPGTVPAGRDLGAIPVADADLPGGSVAAGRPGHRTGTNLEPAGPGRLLSRASAAGRGTDLVRPARRDRRPGARAP